MGAPVTELIKGMVQVRDGFGLIAFITLAILIAFRTKRVPELFFGLVRDKLTRQEFSKILNRFMTLGFIAFLALLALTLISQALGHRTQPNALTVSDLRGELSKVKESTDQQVHAEATYRQALDMLNQRQFDGAIASLKESIQAVPTLTAQETLIRLYRLKGDLPNASIAWEGAMKIARRRGDSVALARLDKNPIAVAPADTEGDHDLIGDSIPLPKGGDKFETAPPIAPGFYICADSGGCRSRWFKMPMRAGQRLEVKWRASVSTGAAGIQFYDTNGQVLKEEDGGSSNSGWSLPSALYHVFWDATTNGSYFIQVNAEPGTVYRLRMLK